MSVSQAVVSAESADRRAAPHSLAYSDWKFVLHPGAVAKATPLEPPAQGFHVDVNHSSDPTPWQAQLVLKNLRVERSQPVVISFAARAAHDRTIGCSVSEGHVPWQSLGLYKTIALRSDWQVFRFEFSPTRDDSDARWHFDLAGDEGAVELTELVISGATYRPVGSQNKIASDPGISAESAAIRWETAEPLTAWTLIVGVDSPINVPLEILGERPASIELIRATVGAPSRVVFQGISLDARRPGRFRVRLRASHPLDVTANVGQLDGQPWAQQEFSVDSEWQSFELLVPASDQPRQGDIALHLRADGPCRVEIADSQWQMGDP